MKEIRRFEEAIANPENKGKSYEELGINQTLFWAYNHSKEAGNELIDFDEVIWDYDIPAITACLREEGITEFTISSTFSSLIETLAAFEKEGIKMDGLTTTKARHTDWQTGEHKILPAIKMIVKEA